MQNTHELNSDTLLAKASQKWTSVFDSKQVWRQLIGSICKACFAPGFVLTLRSKVAIVKELHSDSKRGFPALYDDAVVPKRNDFPGKHLSIN